MRACGDAANARPRASRSDSGDVDESRGGADASAGLLLTRLLKIVMDTRKLFGDYSLERRVIPRSYDLAHLAHVELLSPRPQASLDFFVQVMGLTVSAQDGDSTYLRGWDDYEFHTLKLTAAKTNGLGHFAFRASSDDALQRRVQAVEAAGLGLGWTDGDLGHGPA